MRMKGPRARVRGRVWEEMGGLECEMVESRRTLAPWLSRTRLMVDVVRGPRGRGWADAVGLRPWARAEAVCGFISIGRGVAAHGLWSGEGGFLGIETRARAWGIISGSYQNSVHAQTHGRGIAPGARATNVQYHYVCLHDDVARMKIWRGGRVQGCGSGSAIS